MKIAVIADIHSNASAMDTVLEDVDAWGPDEVIVAGDVVNRGPRPLVCLERILEKHGRAGWRLVRGNHEDFVLLEADRREARPDWEAEIYRHTTWTLEQLGDAVEVLRSWPDRVDIAGPGGQHVRCVHASMIGNRHGVYEHMEDADLGHHIAPAPSVLCVGHTHRPFVRRLGGTLVVNAGAVGLPFDRDPRASYARLTFRAGAWEAEIVRLAYDRDPMIDAFTSTGYLAGGGPMVPLILDELRHARPHLSRWHRDYQDLVAGGVMTVEESVRRQLQERR